MRKLMVSLAVLTTGLMLAAAPSQAAARWTCEGPEFVCGSTSSNVASEDAIERKAARKARMARTEQDDDRPARRRARTTIASTDDDAESRPARRKARTSVANNDDAGDERPARRRTRSYDNDNDGGSSFSGKASYYWEPQALASGGRFNPNAYTAAHKTLPFGTRVRVTNQSNGQSVDVVINDRGPYVAGRVIDLSKAAAHAINMQGAGVAPVSVRVLGRS